MKKNELIWSQSKITLAEREARNNHRGAVIWMTGLSAAGKSSIAVELERKLFDLGANVAILDGDNVRQGLNRDLGFSESDRRENIRRIAELAKLYRELGLIVITAFISPYRKEREFASSLVDDASFFETYIRCSLDTCISRDPKGFYKKALTGEIQNYTGVSAPYEEPQSPEIMIDTEINSISESAGIIIKHLNESDVIH
jgi:adenylyl-sulfate kinase